MKKFFKELFEYTYHYNDKVIDSLLTTDVEVPEKALQLINHTINAQQIWNARIKEEHCTVNEPNPIDLIAAIFGGIPNAKAVKLN